MRSTILVVAILIASTVSLSACAAPLTADGQRLALSATQDQPNACPSKWVAAGNNGAKADRYFQPKCS